MSPPTLWRGSMMALSGRDPYWLAALEHELTAQPAARSYIERTCTRCHAPAGAVAFEDAGGRIGFDAITRGTTAAAHLAREGVTCTACHQITGAGLGTAASFTGGFVLDTGRRIYGPHASPFTMPMQHMVNYSPTQAAHVTTSALCASCHTVITRALDAQGSPTGPEFPEQVPYLEWRNSAYVAEGTPGASPVTCQGCHMPTRDASGAEIRTILANRPRMLGARSPIGQHTFAGANAYMLSLLADESGWTGAASTPDELRAGAALAEAMLRRAATVTVDAPVRAGDVWTFAVRLTNTAGHRFPTAYPSRRAWLHLRVFDAVGAVRFESGRVDASGRLVAADGRYPDARALGRQSSADRHGSAVGSGCPRGAPAAASARRPPEHAGEGLAWKAVAMTPRPMTDVDVLIIGAGPTGLVAAIDARRHGLSVRIVDQSPQRSPHSKALVLHSRSLEVLDDLGCVEAVLQAGREFRALNIVAEGRPVGRVEFRQLAWGDAPYPMWLAIPQSETERCLEERLNALGTTVERQTTLRSLRQGPRAVEADLERADGAVESCRAAWLVGCDGARSDVRRALGVALEGETSGEVFLLADVAMESLLVDGEGYNVLAREGVLFIVPMPTPGRVRLIAHLPEARPDAPPVIDLPMLQQLVDTRTGLRTTLSSLGWTSVFSPKHFIARSLRVGRVFLAGDAAHIHSPVGGQGLNTGIQDGYNLIWKLDLVHRGLAAPTLLDTYQEERHPVGERMIRGVRRATWAMTIRARPLQLVRGWVAGVLLGLARVRNRMGAQIGMLQLRYPASLATAAEPLSAGSPRPGERAAQQASTPALTERLRGTHHTLLLLDGLHESLTEREAQAATAVARTFAADAVEVVWVRREASSDATNLPDPDGAIRRAFGAHRPVAVWVRPDKYVGFRGDPRSTGGLRSYLGGVFSIAALQPQATSSS